MGTTLRIEDRMRDDFIREDKIPTSPKRADGLVTASPCSPESMMLQHQTVLIEEGAGSSPPLSSTGPTTSQIMQRRAKLTSWVTTMELSDFIKNNVEMPLVPVMAAMETEGYRVDQRSLENMKHELEPIVQGLENEIRGIPEVGATFNPACYWHVEALLFDKLRLPVLVETERGARSTNERTLESLKSRHAVVPLLQRHRKLNRILTSCRTLLRQVAGDGRLRVKVDKLAEETGRIYSKSVIHLLSKNIEFPIRNAFIASPGHQIVAAGFVQPELNILAHVSVDKNMLAALETGTDLHGLAAKMVFGLRCDSNIVKTLCPAKYDQVKALQHGLISRDTLFSLAGGLNISQEEAEKLEADYFAQFPAVKKMIEDAHRNAKHDGYVDDLFGRRRQLPDAKQSVPWIGYQQVTAAELAIVASVNAAKRVAQSFIVQAPEATITKLAMIRCFNHINENRPDIRMILQSRDELHFEVPEDEVDHFAAELPALMYDPVISQFGFHLPLAVEVNVGPSWGQLRKWNRTSSETEYTP